MVDYKFRSYRNRDSVAREGSEQTSCGGIGNLLDELARLTGQGDPYADGGRAGASSAVDNRDSVAREGSEQTSRGGIGNLLAELARLTGQGDPYADGGRDGASSALDWAADDASPGQRQQGEDQYVALSRPQPSPVFSRIRPAETIGGRFLPSPQAPTLLLSASDDRHDGDIQAAKTGEAYGANDYYDDLPSPRWRDGLVIVTAVLGLAILGAVGAFAYRAVFGGAVLPALPPLIEAENGPNKNVPNYGDARPSNSSQTSIASAGSSEKFVSRWPADIQEPPKKTAPISPNPSASPPSALGSGAIAPAPAAAPPAVAPPATASVAPHRLLRSRRKSTRSSSAPTGRGKRIPRPQLAPTARQAPRHPRQSRVPQRRLRSEISFCRSLLTHRAMPRRRRRLAPLCRWVREPLRRLPPAGAMRFKWHPNAARPMPTRSFGRSRPSSPTSLAGASRSCAAPISVPRGSTTAP